MSSAPVRILYVITDLNLGGVPLHLCRMVQAMRTKGFAPTVVSLAKLDRRQALQSEPRASARADSPDSTELQFSGVATVSLADQLRQDGVEVFSCGGIGGWDVRILPKLTRLVRAIQPDVVHSLLFHANIAARMAVYEAGLPSQNLICEIQTVEVERRWHLLVDRWTHRGCRLTVGNSPSVVEHLHKQARIPSSRLHLVRGGVDPGPLRSASPAERDSLGVPADAPMVLWVGRLDPVKGLDLLIDAFATVARDSKAHLLLAGGGPIERHLIERIADHRLANRVRLLGPRRDVASLLKTADVFVLPSRTEGLPNSLLEAMAVGCPIVTTDVPGCRDLINHRQSGLLVPYGDVDRLASSILQLITDKPLAAKLGTAAQAAIDQSWHIDQTMNEYARLYAACTR